MATVNAIWDRIEKYLKENDEEAYDALMECKGVDPEEIEGAEEEIGKLPSDLRESLLRHNFPDEPIEEGPLSVFKNYGYRSSFVAMIEAAEAYRSGPLATRFSDSTDTGEMAGLLPIFVYDEDRTYFFTCVHLESNLVCYLDYGDLVGPPSGRVIAWNFKDYLNSLADNLESGAYNYKEAFPEWNFGFHGTDQILSIMPVRRLLQFDDNYDPFNSNLNISKILQEAIDNPTLHIAEPVKPKEQPSEETLGPYPTNCTLLDLTWDTEKISDKEVTVADNGKMLNAKSYNVEAVAKQEITTGRNYWEVIIGPHMNVYEVGITNYVLLGNKRYRDPLPRFTFGFDGRSLSGTRYSDKGSYGTSVGIDDLDDGKLEEGDRVGVLVDMDTSIIEFYLNRKLQAKASLIDVVNKWGSGASTSKMTSVGPCPWASVLPFIFCHMSKLSFNKP